VSHAGERPAYRADQVGSLLRPPALLQAREARAGGRVSSDELRAIEDRAKLELGVKIARRVWGGR
jgi:5-methyltetrahydropteroyltriglutamate--homocysteine methyltransferase